MKKELCYAVLGNANIAADGIGAAVATSWLHGPVHYHREYTVEIPDTILEHPEKYVKAHSSGEEFIKNILFAHNPSFSLPNSLKGWKGTELEYLEGLKV